MLHSPFKDNAIEHGGASEADLRRMSVAFAKFPNNEDAWITHVFCEMIARKNIDVTTG
jgi:hypothetical protein